MDLIKALFRIFVMYRTEKIFVKLLIVKWVLFASLIGCFIYTLPILVEGKMSLEKLVWNSPILCFLIGIGCIYSSFKPNSNLNKFQKAVQWFVRSFIFLMGCVMLWSLKRFF